MTTERTTIRHITPPLGIVPTRLDDQACSGLVGAALGIGQAQSENGDQVQLLGWNPDRDAKQWQLGAVQVHATAGWPWARAGHFDLRMIAPLVNLSRKLGHVDILHVFADPHLLLAPGGRVRVLHLQTPVPELPPRTWSLLLKRADAVVCCSDFIKRQFLERVEFPSDRVFSVHNGVDHRRFNPLAGQSLRESWGIATDIPVILFAGAVVPEKGLLQLLTAAADLHPDYEFEIVVAGAAALWPTPEKLAMTTEDEYTACVRSAATALPVRWLGAVPNADMASVYGASDILVVPSTWDEPFGMVACEAMAAGKPVIASRAGGLPEIVIDEQTGLLVPPSDVPRLTQALRRLLDDRNLRCRLGQQAKSRAVKFTWSEAAEKLSDIYNTSRRSGHEVMVADETR